MERRKRAGGAEWSPYIPLPGGCAGWPTKIAITRDVRRHQRGSPYWRLPARDHGQESVTAKYREAFLHVGVPTSVVTTKPPSGHRNTASVDSYATDASTYDTKIAADDYATDASAYERRADATEASQAAPGHDIPGAEGSVIKEASYDQ